MTSASLNEWVTTNTGDGREREKNKPQNLKLQAIRSRSKARHFSGGGFYKWTRSKIIKKPGDGSGTSPDRSAQSSSKSNRSDKQTLAHAASSGSVLDRSASSGLDVGKLKSNGGGTGAIVPNDNPDIKPRPQRRRRRPAEDRGLPPDEELACFVRAYLRMARDQWPDLAKAGLVPEPTETVVAEMVADFKYRHRSGKIALSRINPLLKRGLTLAAIYPRYSDDNSQPTSIIDQARNELGRDPAMAEGPSRHQRLDPDDSAELGSRPPEQVRAAAEQGATAEAGHRYTHMGEPTYQRIRELLGQGLSHAKIAQLVGCGRSTVSRESKRMKEAGQSSDAA